MEAVELGATNGKPASGAMLKITIRLVADAALVALLLFIGAGTLAWPRAWILLGSLLAIRVLGAIAVHRVNPALVRERAGLPIHAHQPPTDRVLVLAVLATGFLGLPLVTALDAFHWHLLARPHPAIGVIGLVLFALGWTLKSVALYANAFATTVVRLQDERGHVVADSGVYAIVRHPFYAADPLIFIGLGLWLESYTAAVCAIVPIALMVTRLRLEERFLRRELPGYAAYTMRVPHRLIPGVW